MMVQHKQAFTFIELLVVILIISILAAVALPQYQKAVEKSRLSEALVIMDSLQRSMVVWRLSNGLPSSGVIYFSGSRDGIEGIDIDISGLDCTAQDGSPDKFCYSKNFRYLSYCNSSLCTIQATRKAKDETEPISYFLERVLSGTNRAGACYIYDNKGYSICKDLETKGWKVFDKR